MAVRVLSHVEPLLHQSFTIAGALGGRRWAEGANDGAEGEEGGGSALENFGSYCRETYCIWRQTLDYSGASVWIQLLCRNFRCAVIFAPEKVSLLSKEGSSDHNGSLYWEHDLPYVR
jgi:hypothetical protein